MLVRGVLRFLFSLCAFLACARLPLAWADDSVTRLPEVVVEEKREGEEEQWRAPSSTTSLSREQIEEDGVTFVRDAAKYVPNLGITHSAVRSFGDVYSLRGLHNTQLFTDPAVVMYVDDAPYGNVFSYSTDLYDIERIDVLRGPQGTQFGKNSEAGVINITTRKPGERFAADAAFSYGSYDAQHYQADLMGPILTNQLYFGFAGIFEKRDGFLDNTTRMTEPDNQKGLSGRAFLRWTPTKDWDVTLNVTAEDFDDGTQRIVRLGGDHFKVASDFDGETDTQSNGQSLRIEHTATEFTFLSVTSRRDWKLDPFTLDLDLSAFPGNTAIIKQDQQQWTQELRLQSRPDAENWRWLAGFFFSTAETEGDSTRNFFVPVPGFFATERTQFTMDDRTYALFGQVTATVFEKLDVTLGTRLELTHKELDRTKTSTLVAVPPVHADKDFYNIAPKLGLDYRLTENVVLYGSTGLGFKPGGFSAFLDPPSSPEYDSEIAWANEIGVKSKWFDRKLDARVALFYNHVWDYQVERSLVDPTQLTIFNAPEVRSLGAEVELVGRPLEGLELAGTFGYTHSEFVRFNSPITGADLEGNRTPFTPEFNVSVAAQYKHRSGFLGRIEFIAIGQTFYDEANTGAFRQASYGLLNARLGYEGKHFAIYLFGKNLTDTRYFTNKIVDLNAGVPGEPVTIGVMAKISL